jgi:hypothetical protein
MTEVWKGVLKKKHPVRFWIDTNNQVYTFGMVDHQHPEIIEINAELKRDFLDILWWWTYTTSKISLTDVEEEEEKDFPFVSSLEAGHCICTHCCTFRVLTAVGIFKNLQGVC